MYQSFSELALTLSPDFIGFEYSPMSVDGKKEVMVTCQFEKKDSDRQRANRYLLNKFNDVYTDTHGEVRYYKIDVETVNVRDSVRSPSKVWDANMTFKEISEKNS